MKEIGLNAYRFSISWPRILPEGHGHVNVKGLKFYSDLVDELRSNGIEPLVTLYHWDLPQAIQDAGGWLNRRTIDWFEEYATVLYKELGTRVRYWITLNEPQIVCSNGYSIGVHAPFVKDQATADQVMHHLLLAHGRALKAGRKHCSPEAQFGMAPNWSLVFPKDSRPESVRSAKEFWEGLLWGVHGAVFGKYPASIMKKWRDKGSMPVVLPGDMKIINQPLDFMGCNYYFLEFLGPVPKDLVRTEWAAFDHPPAFRDLLIKIKKEFKGLSHPCD